MSIPRGFKYYTNMAIYPNVDYAREYGENLESRYDRAEKRPYKERIFCLDCFDYEACLGRYWRGCPYRAEALKKIRR